MAASVAPVLARIGRCTGCSGEGSEPVPDLRSGPGWNRQRILEGVGPTLAQRGLDVDSESKPSTPAPPGATLAQGTGGGIPVPTVGSAGVAGAWREDSADLSTRTTLLEAGSGKAVGP